MAHLFFQFNQLHYVDFPAFLMIIGATQTMEKTTVCLLFMCSHFFDKFLILILEIRKVYVRMSGDTELVEIGAKFVVLQME